MSTISDWTSASSRASPAPTTPTTTAARFATVHTDPAGLRELLEAERPGLVVFETCTVAGWVADLCDELGLAYAVANPMHEAWSWRKVKRKTDRDDALKLARMAALGELPTVPDAEQGGPRVPRPGPVPRPPGRPPHRGPEPHPGPGPAARRPAAVGPPGLDRGGPRG